MDDNLCMTYRGITCTLDLFVYGIAGIAVISRLNVSLLHVSWQLDLVIRY